MCGKKCWHVVSAKNKELCISRRARLDIRGNAAGRRRPKVLLFPLSLTAFPPFAYCFFPSRFRLFDFVRTFYFRLFPFRLYPQNYPLFPEGRPKVTRRSPENETQVTRCSTVGQTLPSRHHNMTQEYEQYKGNTTTIALTLCVFLCKNIFYPIFLAHVRKFL